jgi:hypothetical protein
MERGGRAGVNPRAPRGCCRCLANRRGVVYPVPAQPSGADRSRRCCRSSVVEHSLGKGEVESSILSGSTITSGGCAARRTHFLRNGGSASPRQNGLTFRRCDLATAGSVAALRPSRPRCARRLRMRPFPDYRILRLIVRRRAQHAVSNDAGPEHRQIHGPEGRVTLDMVSPVTDNPEASFQFQSSASAQARSSASAQARSSASELVSAVWSPAGTAASGSALALWSLASAVPGPGPAVSSPVSEAAAGVALAVLSPVERAAGLALGEARESRLGRSVN